MIKTIFSKEHRELVDQLKKARIEAGIDQITVAKLLKKSQSYVSKVEAGQKKIDVFELKAFAKIYKKKLEYFL